MGWELEAHGDLDQSLPEFAGADKLMGNRIVTVNLWAYACAEKERRLTRDAKLKEEFKKRARTHAELTRNVADLVDKVGPDAREAWCSACFEQATHRRVDAGF